MRIAWTLVALAALAWTGCAQGQVYRCAAADGTPAFQDRPCARGQRQSVIAVPSRAPPGYVPPPVAAEATVAANPASVPPLPPARALPPSPPLPRLYACVDAVNGKAYLAHTPRAPYLVPLGVLGYPPQGLAEVYGAGGGGGLSAPELSTPRVGGPRIATGMTWVQDYCLPAPHAEVCRYVRRRYDANHAALRRAMPREAPPLEAREQKLAAQLQNC